MNVCSVVRRCHEAFENGVQSGAGSEDLLTVEGFDCGSAYGCCCRVFLAEIVATATGHMRARRVDRVTASGMPTPVEKRFKLRLLPRPRYRNSSVKAPSMDDAAALNDIGGTPSKGRSAASNPANGVADVIRADEPPQSGAWEKLAGAGGFEPPNGGTKNRCLTTWRRPNAPRLLERVGALRNLSGARCGSQVQPRRNATVAGVPDNSSSRGAAPVARRRSAGYKPATSQSECGSAW